MKYIIEIEDEPYMREDGVNYYTCKSARWYKLSETIINRLIPYTKPDRKAIENEVWGFVRTVTDMTEAQRIQCFGSATCDLDDYLTYQEAKSKYKAWLKNEINILNIGDEVWNDEMSCKGVVLTVCDTGIVDVLWSDRDIECVFYKKVHKTGRHFLEVAELLEKMRGDNE